MLERGPSQSHLHNSALSCLTSLLEEARCYKRYTQPVRLKSWRNPKGGILSTEVVFSIFFLKKFYIFLEVGMGGGGVPFRPLQLRRNEATGWWPVCEGVHLNTVPWDFFLFHFWEEFGFKTNKAWMSFRGGLQKSSNIRGLFLAGNRRED